MVEAISAGVSSVIGWVGNVVSAITTSEGALNGLLPLVGIGVAVSAVMFGVKIIKGMIWGA